MRQAEMGDGRGARARGRSAAWLAAASFCLALAAPAAAQKPAKAEALFQEGLKGMRAGRYEAACPKLAESYRLDPVPGALFTVAECEAAWGKVATAVEHYQLFVRSLASLSSRRRDTFEERRRLAVEKIAALGPLSPELTIAVPPAAPAGLVVKRNDMIVDPSAYGVSKKVDPGDYVLRAELDGSPVWERRVTLGQRDSARIDVLEPAAGAPASAAGAPASAAPPSPPTEPASSLRTFGYIASGVGVAGLAVGIASGAIALGQKSTIDANCPDLVCNAEGRRAVTKGKTAALVSTVSLPLGVFAAAGAVVLFVVSRPSTGKSARAGHGPRPGVIGLDRGAAITLEGVF